jgi:DNA-binding response OmpR family regulator
VGSALERRAIAGARVLVVSANESDVAAIGDVLADDDLLMMRMRDVATTRAGIGDGVPDLAIVDMELPDGDGLTLIPVLREVSGRLDFPIIFMVAVAETERLLSGLAEASFDVLPKPFSPPMLRARIRAWLSRTLNGGPSRRRRRGALMPEAEAPSFSELLAAMPLFRSLARDDRERLLAGDANRGATGRARSRRGVR